MLDVVVHASTRPEPFGLTIAEATSCGKPVIVAAAGLFTPGHDPLAHRPGHAADLAAAIARVAAGPAPPSRLGGQRPADGRCLCGCRSSAIAARLPRSTHLAFLADW
jgi:glycosyltransferase involved in cell wall biosynthesis